MKRQLCFLLILFHSLSLNAQWHFGGTIENGMSSLFSEKDDYSYFSDNFSLNPTLHYNGEILEFRASAELSYEYPENNAALAMDEVFLTFYNYGIWKAQIGRFHYMPGSSEFFSNTNYFSTADYIKLIENQGKDFNQPGDMFQLSFIGSNMYIKNTFSITPVYSETVSADSPWLPTNLLRENLYIYTVGLFSRQSIYTQDPTWPDISIQDLTYNLEAGYSSYWFDLSLQYYRGWDNTPLNRVRYEILENNQFDLTIIPEYQKKTSLGLNTTVSWNSFHFWFDGSYTLNKKLENRILLVPQYLTSITETPSLEGTIGFRYDFSWQNMSILLERKESHIFYSEDGTVTPYMSSALAGAVHFFFMDYKHHPGAFILYHLEDKSWMSAIQWEYFLKDNFSLEGTVGKLEGKSDTLFGHYEQNWLISFNLNYQM